jgi:hypothetical protein
MPFAELLSLRCYASHIAVQFFITCTLVCNITFRTNKSIQIPTTLFFGRLLVYLAVGQLVNKSIPNDMEGRHYGQSPPLHRNRSYNNSMLT